MASLRVALRKTNLIPRDPLSMAYNFQLARARNCCLRHENQQLNGRFLVAFRINPCSRRRYLRNDVNHDISSLIYAIRIDIRMHKVPRAIGVVNRTKNSMSLIYRPRGKNKIREIIDVCLGCKLKPFLSRL